MENLSLTYSYADQEFHDVNTEFDNTVTHRGALAYVHNPKPREVKPLANIRLINKSKWLKLFKEFNFNLGFKQLSLRSSIDRGYNERLIRANPDIASLTPRPTYNKNFNWNSQYGFRYEITKSLKLDFNANNMAFIGETPGRVNSKDRDEYALWKDSVLTSLRNWGEPTRYDHTVAVTYTLPLDKFPMTDWMTVNTGYTAGYQWDRAPLTQDSLGATIQNSQNMWVNNDLDQEGVAMSACNPKGCGCVATPVERPMLEKVQPGASQTVLRIENMDCPTEEALIRGKLSGLPAVSGLDFKLMQRTLRVSHVREALPAMMAALGSIGFKAEVMEAASGRQRAPVAPRTNWWPLVASGAAAALAELGSWLIGGDHWAVLALALFAIFSGGLPLTRRAGLRSGTATSRCR